MPKEKILIVDDEPNIRMTLVEALQGWGYDPIEAGTITAGRELFDAEQPLAVLQDVNLPDGSGIDALRQYKKHHPQAVVIMITGNVQLEDTIAALRGGAYDFISKPIRLNELQVTIRNGLEASKLRREVVTLRRERAQQFNFDQIIGQSTAMTEMLRLARKVAASEASSVLLQGASGTGKDLIAKAIHYGSTRADHPFIAINCAAIPGTLLESELFGHEKGAFTDAKVRKEGLFEQAQGGTLFLEEIGDLTADAQARLLRFLNDQTYERLGEARERRADVRILAATNRTLEDDVRAGRFREDLWFRLNVITLTLPPLRERPEDLLAFASHYLAFFAMKQRRPDLRLSPAAKQAIVQHRWPGNLRELRNTVERAVILSPQPVLEVADLGLVETDPGSTRPGALVGAMVSLEELEREHIASVIARTPTLDAAARTLGIDATTLQRKRKRYNLT
jgi:NtrC-family two-component system response regulator AlgB